MNNILKTEFGKLPHGRELRAYRQQHMRSISGWVRDEALLVTSVLTNEQLHLNVTGSVVEIGVHHAKFLAFLGLLAAEHEAVVGFDLFEDQAQNVDGSGHGCRENAVRNLEKAGLRASDVKLLACNSLELDAEAVLAECGGQRCRIFSVDGGHTSEITQKDLETAFGVLAQGGIVILDDYFNHGWPGVSEGALRFCFGNPSLCIPIAIGGNKVWFTNDQSFASGFVSALRRHLADVSSKNSCFLGHDIFVIEPFESLESAFIKKLKRASRRLRLG